jgi:hypothetical protein
VLYEHGEQWSHDLNKGKILIRPLSLRQSYQQTYLAANLDELGEGNDGFGI